MAKKSPKTESADGIAQASKLMGIPLALLRAAKRAGAPGFRHGRVYFDDVKEWLDSNSIDPVEGDAPDIQTARLQKIREEVRKLKLVNDRNAGSVIDVSEVNSALATACSEWNSARVHLEAEGPAKMAGKEADECRVAVRAFADEVGAVLHRALGKFSNQPKDTL